jgi:hypothetical protein
MASRRIWAKTALKGRGARLRRRKKSALRIERRAQRRATALLPT